MNALFITAALLLSVQDGKENVYLGSHGDQVVVRSKKKAESTPESRLEFYSRDKQMLCAFDYTSRDGEHGYGVEKAAWTPDGNYFVVTVVSSGGHQAWHSPTIVYSRNKKWLVSLDDFIDGQGISSSNFDLVAPHTLTTHMLKGREMLIDFNLDDLFRRATMANIAKGVSCTAGKTRKAGLLR